VRLLVRRGREAEGQWWEVLRLVVQYIAQQRPVLQMHLDFFDNQWRLVSNYWVENIGANDAEDARMENRMMAYIDAYFDWLSLLSDLRESHESAQGALTKR